MSLSDLASIGSFVSGLAVLASLLYLALQVRQADRNQRAVIQQGRIARSSDQLMRLCDPALTSAWVKGIHGRADISEEEFLRFLLINTAVLRSTEDVIFQHRLGLLDSASLENQLGPARGILSTPGGKAFWRVLKSGYDPEFVERVDRILQRQNVVSEFPPFMAWKAEVAALATAAQTRADSRQDT